ncbi:hypothetical protein ACNKHU_18615 [Shigella flexneri]
MIEDASDMLLAITQAGRMLMFPVSDLPELSKGKASKIINIPSRSRTWRRWSGPTYVLPPQGTLPFMLGTQN